MRKLMCLTLLAAMAAANGGCVVAMGNKGSLKACNTHDRQAVSINGMIYIVDVNTGDVMRVEQARVDGARGFVVTESVKVETSEESK